MKGTGGWGTLSLEDTARGLERINHGIDGSESDEELIDYCLNVLIKDLFVRLNNDKDFERSFKEFGYFRRLFCIESGFFWMVKMLELHNEAFFESIESFKVALKEYLARNLNYLGLHHLDFLDFFCNKEVESPTWLSQFTKNMKSTSLMITRENASSNEVACLLSLGDFSLKISQAYLGNSSILKPAYQFDKMKNGESEATTWEIDNLSLDQLLKRVRSLKLVQNRKKIFYYDYRVGWIKVRVIDKFKTADLNGKDRLILRLDLSGYRKAFARLTKKERL